MEEDSTSFEFDFSFTTLGRIGQSLFLLNYAKRNKNIVGIYDELNILHDELRGIIGINKPKMIEEIENLRSIAEKEYSAYINSANAGSKRLPSTILFSKMRDWELGIRLNPLFSRLNLKADEDASRAML